MKPVSADISNAYGSLPLSGTVSGNDNVDSSESTNSPLSEKERLEQERLHRHYYSLGEESSENHKSPYVQLMDKKIWNGKSTAEILDSNTWFKAQKDVGTSYNILSLPMKLYFHKNLRDLSMGFIRSPLYIIDFVKFLFEKEDSSNNPATIPSRTPTAITNQ